MRSAVVAMLVLPGMGGAQVPPACGPAHESLALAVFEAAYAQDAAKLDELVGREAVGAGGSFSARVLPAQSYRFVKLRQEEGRCHALMRRVYPDDEGFEYHELRMEAGRDGKPRVVEVRFDLGLGEDLAIASSAFGALYAIGGKPEGAAFEALLAARGADAVFASVERVGRSIGGDTFLHGIRSRAHLHFGRSDAAMRELEGAIERDPGYLDAYGELLGLYLDAALYAKAVALLERAEGQFEFLAGTSEVLAGEHPEFLDSPECKAWLARRGAARR